MVELVLLVVVIFLVLIWLSIRSMAAKFSHISSSMNSHLERIDERSQRACDVLTTIQWRLQQIEERVADNFQTNKERQDDIDDMEP